MSFSCKSCNSCWVILLSSINLRSFSISSSWCDVESRFLKIIKTIQAIITTNTSVALVVPLVITIVSSIIQGLAKGKIFAYLPTMCWNLTEFLNGGLPIFKYSTFYKSLAVDIVTVFILFFISYILFKRKDIKNQ